jgi:hypothetical protein
VVPSESLLLSVLGCCSPRRRLPGGASSRHPAVGRHRPGRHCQDASHGIGRCPASGVQPIRGRRPGSGGPAVQCPARPVSGHLGSSSGCPAVRSSAVHPSGVQPSGVQPAAVRPVGPDPSVSSIPGGGVGPRSVRRASVTTGTGRVPVGCRAVERFGRRPSRPGRGRCCRARVLVSGGLGWRTRAGLGTAAARARCATSRPGRRAERPWLAAERGHRVRLRREVAAPAAWLPSGAGWRPPWVVAVGPAARVGGPGGADRLAGGDGRAAPARPRLAASVPGSRPAAL